MDSALIGGHLECYYMKCSVVEVLSIYQVIYAILIEIQKGFISFNI